MVGHVDVEYTGLKAENSIKKCTVENRRSKSIADLESVEDSSSGTMGVKFPKMQKAKAPSPNIKLEGCALAGTYPVTGNATATGGRAEWRGSGATSVFEAADEELTFFAAEADLPLGRDNENERRQPDLADNSHIARSLAARQAVSRSTQRGPGHLARPSFVRRACQDARR